MWQRVESGEEFVVTRNGLPCALLLQAEPGEVEDLLRAHRAARLGAVVRRLQRQAPATLLERKRRQRRQHSQRRRHRQRSLHRHRAYSKRGCRLHRLLPLRRRGQHPRAWT